MHTKKKFSVSDFRFIFLLSSFFICSLFHLNCATTYLNGITPEGQKVYLGSAPTEETEAFQTFKTSAQTQVDEQNYLFQRLKSAKELKYYHDGVWYGWLEAYRGGMWLMRNKYKKGQDSRTFLKDFVWRSESGEPHLVRYPDGSIHVGYYVLLNELDLLEQLAGPTK